MHALYIDVSVCLCVCKDSCRPICVRVRVYIGYRYINLAHILYVFLFINNKYVFQFCSKAAETK